MQAVLNSALRAKGCARGQLLKAHECLVQQAEALQRQERWLHTRLRQEGVYGQPADAAEAEDFVGSDMEPEPRAEIAGKEREAVRRWKHC